MDGGTDFRILNLNCWGIPYLNLSKLRKERMLDIAEELAKGACDVVCLQEIWSVSDFERLRTACMGKYPYSHYFHSGVIGSGLCVFSKSPIVGAFYHHYSVNGYPHRIFHGDWFGGKMVGLCQILHHGLTINVYVTHFHAEYNHTDKPYHGHRLVQAFEMCQFIEHTGQTSHVNVIAGDFNTEPEEIGYKLITKLLEMKDSWTTQTCIQDACDGSTSDVPSNSFTKPSASIRFPKGKRIDYVMYQVNDECDIECLESSVTMGRVPGKDYNFSDHEAVDAKLKIHKKEKKPLPEFDEKSSSECIQVLEDVIGDIKTGHDNLKTVQLWTRIGLIISLSLCLLWFIPHFDKIKLVALVLATLGVSYMFVMATVGIRMERKAYTECINNMTLKLNSLKRERKS
ncbi:putative neutral sphingomyelinase [Ptychodera flava]|uniref:putative neutral sphingomyelinase n=1 Tax=Ptychodera flava TaxID=63121 RepID=UPI00396AAA54